MSNAKDYLPEIPKDPSAAAPSSSRRFTRGASDKGEQQSSQRQKDKQRQQQQQQQNTGYVDVIDKLDFSGLNMSCESRNTARRGWISAALGTRQMWASRCANEMQTTRASGQTNGWMQAGRGASAQRQGTTADVPCCTSPNDLVSIDPRQHRSPSQVSGLSERSLGVVHRVGEREVDRDAIE